MRHDIKKVICERERRGHFEGPEKGYDRRSRSHNRDDHDEEFHQYDLPKYESLTKRYGYNRKSFSDRLRAIEGFIRKNVGRHWDKVYSEVCQLAKPNGTNTHYHVHQHLEDFIEINTFIGDDSEIRYVTKGRFSFMRKEDNRIAKCPKDFYVHPISKQICFNKKRAKEMAIEKKEWLRKRNEVHEFVKIINDECALKIHGNWFIFKIVVISEESIAKMKLMDMDRVTGRWKLINSPDEETDEIIRELPRHAYHHMRIILNGRFLKERRSASKKDIERFHSVKNAA